MAMCPVNPDLGNENLGLAFGLVTAAGLSTTVGAAIAFCMPYKDPSDPSQTNLFLAASLALAAGVMLYVSFMEIFAVKAVESFTNCYEDNAALAYLFATLAFFGGVGLMYLFDWALHVFQASMIRRAAQNNATHAAASPAPAFAKDLEDSSSSATRSSGELPFSSGDTTPVREVGNHVHMDTELAHDGELVAETVYPKNDTASRDLVRMGIFAGIAIAFHNFPEGLATFVSTLEDPSVGAAVAIAIGIHNIPEGICVAMPIYYATGSKGKAFFWATLSGVTELIGALLGWLVLRRVFNDLIYGVLFGLVAGMMVYISVKELLPGAHRYDPEDKVVTFSLVAGMFIMAGSLVLFAFTAE